MDLPDHRNRRLSLTTLQPEHEMRVQFGIGAARRAVVEARDAELLSVCSSEPASQQRVSGSQFVRVDRVTHPRIDAFVDPRAHASEDSPRFLHALERDVCASTSLDPMNTGVPRSHRRSPAVSRAARSARR